MHKTLDPLQWVLLCLKSKSRCLLGLRCALKLCTVIKHHRKQLTLIMSPWLPGLAANPVSDRDAAKTAAGEASAAVSCCSRQVDALVPRQTK